MLFYEEPFADALGEMEQSPHYYGTRDGHATRTKSLFRKHVLQANSTHSNLQRLHYLHANIQAPDIPTTDALLHPSSANAKRILCTITIVLRKTDTLQNLYCFMEMSCLAALTPSKAPTTTATSSLEAAPCPNSSTASQNPLEFAIF